MIETLENKSPSFLFLECNNFISFCKQYQECHLLHEKQPAYFIKKQKLFVLFFIYLAVYG
jgi:hypothetical protein